MKKLILLYGLPGSGKTTLAKELENKYIEEGLVIRRTETDDWFVLHGGGTYKFDASLLNKAHQITFQLVQYWMQLRTDVIILSNTNLTWKDIKGYCELAIHNAYEVEIVETQTEWRYDLDELEKRGIHAVPRVVLERMNNKRQSIEHLRAKIKQAQNRSYQW